MAGQVNIGGSNASVQLTGNDDITQNQEVLFPDTAGASATVVVSPGTADIETTGDIDCGKITATGTINSESSIRAGNLSAAGTTTRGANLGVSAATGQLLVQQTAAADANNNLIRVFHGDVPTVNITGGGRINAAGTIAANNYNPGFDEASGITLAVSDTSSTVGIQQVSTSATNLSALNIYQGKTPVFNCLYSGNITASGSLRLGTSNLSNLTTGNSGTLSVNTMDQGVYGAGSIGLGRATADGVQGNAFLVGFVGSSRKVCLFTNGNADFAGTVTPANVTFKLEPENEAHYTVTQQEFQEDVTGPLGQIERTVTKTREVREYCGPVLNVRETLQSLLERAEQQDAVIADLTRQLTELKGAN